MGQERPNKRHKDDKSWRLTPETFPPRLHLQNDMRYFETCQAYVELTLASPHWKSTRRYLLLFALLSPRYLLLQFTHFYS